ncbi:hypothetical protein B0H14DRAFT_3767158 [Mycena olivaceomarginata]|nr:hypothetical protein B0H14DRAFT_3767158 [Mycena olivaceomarginata]
MPWGRRGCLGCFDGSLRTAPMSQAPKEQRCRWFWQATVPLLSSPTFQISMSYKHTGSAVSTSTPVNRVFFFLRPAHLFPRLRSANTPAVTAAATTMQRSTTKQETTKTFFAGYPLAKENTGGSPPSRKVQRQERRRAAKKQHKSSASGGNEKAKGKSRSVLTPREATTYGPPTSGKGKGKVDVLLNEDSDIVDEDGAVATNMLVNEDSYIVDEDATNTIPKPWRRPKPTKDEASDRVDSMWSTAFTAAVNWIQESQTALQVVRPAVDQLFAVHQVGARHQHIESINATHPVLRHLPVGASNFLLDVARGHRASAVETAVRNGVLVYSRPDEAKDTAGQITYVRVAAQKQDSDECSPAACLERYMLKYPSDLGWAAAGLIFLGKTTAQIKQIVKKVVEARKISRPPSQLFRALEHVDDLPNKPTFSGFPLYYGISDEQTPNDRLQTDLKEGQTRFSNFAKANEDYIDFQAYGIPTCYVPGSAGIRTDRDAGDVEVFLTHTSNGIGLNHAIGGSIPYITLPADVSTIVSSSAYPHPFGNIPVPNVTAKVTEYINDQKRFLSQSDPSNTISQTAYERLLRDGPGVFRTNSTGVAGIRLLDIISLESYDARRGRHEVGGLWEERSGRALKTFRHLICLMEPHLPLTGDLNEANIAKCLGPTIDIWPLSPKPLYFWLHCLWTSRVLIEMDVVVSTTWSAVPDVAVGGGFLAMAWRGIPQDIRTAVLNGVTPPNIKDFLPQTESPHWTPPNHFQTDYLNNVGVLRIVQHASVHSRVALIIVLVEKIYRVALSEVIWMRQEGHFLRRVSAEEALGWFNLLRERVEARLLASGLRQKLDEIRMCTAGTHGHEATCATLRRDYQQRLAFGGNPDPFHHIGFPFDDDPFGPEMKKWLSVVTPLAYANAMRTRAALPQNKAALSLGGHRGTETMRAKSLRQSEVSKALLLNRLSFGPLRCLWRADLGEHYELHSHLQLRSSGAPVGERFQSTISSRARATRRSSERHLPGLDLSLVRDLKVYRKQKETDEAEWELTLAVDACFPLVSRCPPQLWPTTASDRGKAWTHGGEFDKWGPGKGRVYPFLRPNKALLKNGEKTNKCKGGPQDCDSEVAIDKHLITDEFDLPPDYLQALWFHQRVFPKLNPQSYRRNPSLGSLKDENLKRVPPEITSVGLNCIIRGRGAGDGTRELSRR